MQYFPAALQELADQFGRLPGIGGKTAQRLAFYVLGLPQEEAQAFADAIAMLNAQAPNDQVIKLKAIEAMEKVANGKATKIIIPSEMQGLVGLASGLVEGVKE